METEELTRLQKTTFGVTKWSSLPEHRKRNRWPGECLYTRDKENLFIIEGFNRDYYNMATESIDGTALPILPDTEFPIMLAYFCILPKRKMGILFSLAFGLGTLDNAPQIEQRRYTTFLLDYLEQSELCRDIEAIFHDTSNVGYTYTQTGTNIFVDF